jgi:predicted anti-sigma-YlaC factor YlaD
MHRGLAFALLGLLSLTLSACSIQKFAVKKVADSLTRGSDVYGTDNDPELVRDALPFGLKTMEGLLAVVPSHQGLLLALCQGFTSYSFAFVQSDGDLLVNSDYEKSTALHERALKLYLRARGYGLRGLELRYKGITRQLQLEPEQAAARIQKRDLPMLYWTAASWGAAIALGKDQPDLLADLPAIRALMERGLALDESFQGGAIHEALITLDALPEAMGGSETRARHHFERAVALSHDAGPGPYLTLATTVAVLKQDRAEFEELLNKALTFDPDKDPASRMQTIVQQRKARSLLDREDEFFLDAAPADGTAPDESSAPPDTTLQERR